MNDASHNATDDGQLDISQGLRDDLRTLSAAGGVPATVDEAVLNAAQPWFVRQRRRRLILRFTLLGAGAAAASILLLAAFLPARMQSRTQAASPRASEAYVEAPPTSDAYVEAPPTDVAAAAEFAAGQAAAADAGRGRVTILNAFALARRLKSGDAPRPEWDANRDGVVDRRDVDALALAAVRVAGGT